MASGGVELASAYISILPSMAGLQAQINKEFGGVNKAAESTGKSAGSKLASGVKNGAMVAGGAIVGILGAALVKGFSRLSAIENAEASLKGLGNSASDVKNIMKDALGAVKGTAFGMDEAAQTAAGAVASGIKPGKELSRTLKLVGDAATIGKTSMADMGAVFNKVSSSGKIQGDVLAQLGDKGIPIVSLLGKSLGKTSAEITKMASKGEIDFAMFQDAMEAGMGGAALKSGNTTTGAFKNMNAALGRLGAGLLKGAFPLFGKVFNGITGMLDKLEAKLTPLATVFSTELAGGITAFGAAWKANDGDITSSGFPGFMERLAFITKTAFIEMRGGVWAFKAAWDANDGDITSSGFPGFMERSAYVVHQLVDAAKLLDFTSFRGFLDSLKTAGGPAGNAMGSIGESVKALIPAFQEFAKQLPNIGGAVAKVAAVGLTLLTGALAFLADHVDTIIKFMPLIVAGFIAYKVASMVAAKGTFALQAAQVAMTPVITLNNILRLTAIHLEGRQTSALAASTIAQVQNNGAQNAGLIGKTRYVLALAAQRVATMGATIATNAATIAQKGLNLALRMNPIGLIITVIAALVAGFILAYNKIGWFKDGVNAAIAGVGAVFGWLWNNAVKPVFDWIMGGIGALVGWFKTNLLPGIQAAIGATGAVFSWLYAKAIKPAFDGIMAAVSAVVDWFKVTFLPGVQAVFKAVGDVFMWYINTIVRPVFSAVFTVVNGFYLFFRGIFQLVVAVFKEIIAPAFVNFWRGVVVPVFAAIGALIGAWWGLVSGIFTAVVGFVKTVLGAVFTWLRDSVITPVFKFIKAAIGLWWTGVKIVFDAAVSFVRTVLGAVFTWFRDSVITPVFGFIKGAISLWWTGVKIVFEAVIGFLRNTLGVAFTWFRDSVITPVFNSVRDIIKNVWEKGIKPVFDFLSNAIKNDVPAAFNKGVDGVKKIWDTLLDIAKKPVKFVVNTVINDGLIGAFNKVAGILPGIDKLPRVALPAGFRNGGYTGNYGVDSIAGVVHGNEHVIRAESRKSIESTAPGLLDRLNQMGAAALDSFGYRKGGRVNPTKNMGLTQGYSAFHDGIDIGVPSGTPVFATGDGTVTHAGPGFRAPGVWGGNEIHIKGDGIERWFAHLSQIGVQLGQKVMAGQQIGLSGNTGISSGPHLHFGAYSGGWPNSMNPLSYLAGASAPAGGKGGSGGGFNPFGALSGLADGVMKKVTDAIPGGGFMVKAAAGIGKKLITGVVDWAKGKLGMGAVTGAPTLFDGGGWLTNTGGPQLIDHQRSKPDAVLTSSQWDLAEEAIFGGGRGMTYSPTYQWAGDDPHAVMAKDKARMRDLQSVYGF